VISSAPSAALVISSAAGLRRFAVARQFGDRPLAAALESLGFVQADPIRAPARAQDLTLRHRVSNYRAGDLERRYASLPIEEDFFINYGFVTRRVSALMHPRAGAGLLPSASNQRAHALLAYIRQRGEVHPRDVDAHFAHGTVTNWWGGRSSATTQLLELMHYKGLLRIARRDTGIRIYAVHQHAPGPRGAAEKRQRLDALVDVVVRKYAPLPGSSLSGVVRRLRYAVPQFSDLITGALLRAKQRLASATIDGETWYWPAEEPPPETASLEMVRFLAPFDPLVWDRRKFEQLWGWAYRFEAYTPVKKRKLGYYALPLLWQDRVIGWVNVSNGVQGLRVDAGYVEGRAPRVRAFKNAFDAEVERLRTFLIRDP
jgi:uncharacterized protein YcaQ